MQCPRCNMIMRFINRHISLSDNDSMVHKEDSYYCPHCNDYIKVSAECYALWFHVKFFSDWEGELS